MKTWRTILVLSLLSFGSVLVMGMSGCDNDSPAVAKPVAIQAPEIDVAGAGAGLTLLIGCLIILRSRKV